MGISFGISRLRSFQMFPTPACTCTPRGGRVNANVAGKMEGKYDGKLEIPRSFFLNERLSRGDDRCDVRKHPQLDFLEL